MAMPSVDMIMAPPMPMAWLWLCNCNRQFYHGYVWSVTV